MLSPDRSEIILLLVTLNVRLLFNNKVLLSNDPKVIALEVLEEMIFSETVLLVSYPPPLVVKTTPPPDELMILKEIVL